MKAIALIQANHTDLLPGDLDPSHYCVGPLRSSGRFHRIVLAAPDTGRNEVFRSLAAGWGIDCYLGSEFDVVRRLIQAAEMAETGLHDAICRVLLNRFYLDTDLVGRMAGFLASEKADFVALPYDFDINFAADVMTLECLLRVDRCLAMQGSDHLRFRPWGFIEDHTDRFRVSTYEDVPTYPRSRLQEIRGSGLFAERDCGTCSSFSYRFVLDFLAREDAVLDISCGRGEGSAILTERCDRVHGADLCEETIREARKSYSASNLTFDVQNGCAMTYRDESFNAIVCLNTLEHVEDDRGMLNEFHRVLRPGGRLILETPLLRARPFNFPLISSHLREYEKQPLLDLVYRAGFVPERMFGMNRGRYIGWEQAREAALVIARRSA